MLHGAWRSLLLPLLAYTAAAVLGRASHPAGVELATFWPAAGVGFLWMADALRRSLLRVLLVGVLLVVSTTLCGVLTGFPLLSAAVLGSATSAQALMGALLQHRLQPRGLRLRAAGDLWCLLLAGFAGSLVGAAIATETAAAALQQPTLSLGVSWLVRHTTGTVVIAALWLLCTDPRLPRTREGAGWVEVVAVNVAAALTFTYLFGSLEATPLGFLGVPAAIWMGIRVRTRVAVLNIAIVDVTLVALTRAGQGTFGPLPAPQRMLDVQLLVLLLTVVVVALSLHRDDRTRLVESLRRSHRAAEQQSRLLAAVFETTSDAMSVYAPDGRLLRANSAAQTMNPWPEGETPATRALCGEHLHDVDVVLTDEVSGGTRTYNVAAHPLPHEDGAEWSGGALIAVRDVTVTRAAAAEVARSREFYVNILDGATEQLIIATDLDGSITAFNTGAERLLGYTGEAILGCSVQILHDLDEVVTRAEQLGVAPGMAVFSSIVEATGEPQTQSWTLLTQDGRRRQVMLTISLLFDSAGHRIGLIGIGTDVTDQVATQARLADSEQRFRTVFDTAPVGMLLVGLQPGNRGRILQVNSTICAFTGRGPEELCVLDLHALVPVEGREQFDADFAPLLDADESTAQFEHTYQHIDATIRWGRLSATRVEHDGVEPYLLCLVEDVTARRQAEEALVHQALHDPLTGLANRTLLRDRLTLALEESRAVGSTVGVLLIDLDGFKAVNDTAGHGAGDELLRVISQRLTDCSRQGDTLARLGGDEFAVVCPDADAAGLRRIAQRFLAAVRAPVVLGAGTFHVGASIGSAAWQAGDADPGSVDGLLRNADLAMYAAKRDGKNRIYAYDDRDRDRSERSAKLLPRLAAALEAREFLMYGQPIVEIATGRIVAVETLLRWARPDGSVLSPAAFLDVLEKSLLMPAVGRFVMEESCRLAGQWWRKLGELSPAVHVNVSASQLDDGTFRTQIEDVLRRHGVPPQLLVLELTETHTTRITDTLRADLELLRDQGIRIAIDDLGTGYSGLARLTELPVDALKIDLQFVAGLG
ncbi:MAG: EAL domain-containing protein, partial [Janthinobacterium lividum]